jgi:hypothetical protein
MLKVYKSEIMVNPLTPDEKVISKICANIENVSHDQLKSDMKDITMTCVKFAYIEFPGWFEPMQNPTLMDWMKPIFKTVGGMTIAVTNAQFSKVRMEQLKARFKPFTDLKDIIKKYNS